MKINPVKLHKELVAAGIPIDGVSASEPPRIDFREKATTAQREEAQRILAAHVPEDYQDKRLDAYRRQGLSPEAMVIALWERIVEGRPEASEALQTIREQIKAQFPKGR